MMYDMKISLPREAMPETDTMVDIAKKLPPEKQASFLQFWRGVNYGLDMAGVLSGQTQAGEPRAAN